jgi:hypothetical protein
MLAKEQLSVLLGTCIVPSVLENISDVFQNEQDRIKNFYSSELYSNLQRAETGLWHLSAKTLAEMYRQEIAEGHIDYPEEQS